MPGPDDNWTNIPASNPGCPNDQDSNPTCPQEVPAGTPGTETFNLDWDISDNIQVGDRTDEELRVFYDSHRHQCILVELDSEADANIVTKSVYRNMDFVNASSFSQKAEISAKGYPLPAGMTAQKFSIYVTKRQNPLRLARLWDLFGVGRDPGAGGFRKDQTVSQLTWSAYGFRHLGKYITINQHPYEVIEPAGSFGYFVRHAGNAPVRDWNDRLLGAQPVGENLYQLTVPNGETATVTTQIEPREYGLLNWLTWLLFILLLLLLILLILIITGRLGGNTSEAENSSQNESTSHGESSTDGETTSDGGDGS
jgi:hypothetical protein